MILFVNENTGVIFIKRFTSPVLDWFKEIFSQVSSVTVKRTDRSNLWKS